VQPLRREAIEEQLESALEEVVKRNFAVDLTRHRLAGIWDAYCPRML